MNVSVTDMNISHIKTACFLKENRHTSPLEGEYPAILCEIAIKRRDKL
jgi:hypothetical protein